MRDDFDEEIEPFKGFVPTRRLSFPALSSIGPWAPNPRDSKDMIVGYTSQQYSEKYGAGSEDLETTQATIRYVGHGAHVTFIRTTEADPSTFVTAAKDGVVRLYDVRAPTPALAIYHADEFTDAALYEHIGRHPFVVIGGGKTEEVKVRDVRAQLPLYELSTGNTKSCLLHGMVLPRPSMRAPSASSSTAWAGITSIVEVPESRESRSRVDLDEDEHHQDSNDYDGHNWPSRAYHDESAYGRMMNSAGHRVYAYRFKEDADANLVSASGYSSLGGPYAHW
ncbi:hypothetical protein BDV98DRAFT_565148 [Pterulicium gracile]|uniref:WD40-repeat-containing domain protein n=1 Tax=Pterulicium gracile TaxID=1884261 RepID=A0A5C3QX69_9AGAR|nr:hypothetical protein BDV98DRAFT_565148 [Pterula gracilis]